MIEERDKQSRKQYKGDKKKDEKKIREDNRRVEPLRMQLFPKEEHIDRGYLIDRKENQTGWI